MPEPRRAVVLSGGGAKGIFESGVVHALAQTGYEAEVITGSSVGALNAVGYAEVVRVRREEGADPSLRVAESLLTLWQQIDRLKVADIDAWGWRVWAAVFFFVVFGFTLVMASLSGGAVKPWLAILERIAGFLLGLLAVGAGALALGVWLDLPSILRKRVWGGRRGEQTRTTEATSGFARLARLGLRLGGFLPSLFGDRGLRHALGLVVPAHRRLSEYRKAGLDVRLTRTNVRTGRTEISEFLEPRDMDRPGFDRGLRVIGDPRAVEAALASSAFPGAFPAVRADAIYVTEENRSLYARARDRSLAKKELKRVFGPASKQQYVWLMSLIERLTEEDANLTRAGGEARLLEKIRAEFYGARAAWNRVSVPSLFLLVETRGWPQIPVPGEAPYADRYIDGGILDNTPLSTALRALREADADADADANPSAVPDAHQMLVVLLSPRARKRYLAAAKAERLQGPALGLRALRLQAEGRVEDDVQTAEKIDRLLAEKGWAEEELEASRKPAPAAAARAAVPAGGVRSESWAELFSRESGIEAGDVPAAGVLHVEEERLVRIDVTRVYPTWDLPWIFSLDDRLGFSTAQARQFQVRGCRDTMAALASRYGERSRTGGAVPPGAARAIQLTKASGATVAAGWICPTERCTLRATCDLVASDERAQAVAEGAVASA